MNDIIKYKNLVRMSDEIQFVGINREDSASGDRPSYAIGFIPPGEHVSISWGPGNVGKDAEEPYFQILSCLGGENITVSFTEMKEAANRYGWELNIKDLKSGNVKITIEDMHELSKKTGLNQFSVDPGGAKICKECQSKIRNYNSSIKCKRHNEVVVFRYNDWIEYCFEIEVE